MSCAPDILVVDDDSDEAARCGGEEFALILPNAPKSGAMTMARAIQRVFAAQAMPHPAAPR